MTGKTKNDLFELLLNDLKENENIILDGDLPLYSGIKKKLWKAHHSVKFNRRRIAPFRSIWNLSCSLRKYEKLFEKDEYCIIFNNVSVEFFEPGYLNKIKKKYGVKLVMYYLDTFKSYYSEKARINSKYIHFDKTFTLHKQDAFEHDMLFFDTYYSKLIEDNHESDKKVFFWGSDGGRREKIEKVFALLTQNAIDTDFGICFCDPEKEKKAGITYNQPLEYMDMLKRMNESDCILDIVGDYSGAISLRAYEAVVYGKKLITNNPLIRDMRFYNSENIQIFDDVDEIDLSFFRKNNVCEYNYNDEFSPLYFIKRLEEIL